MALKGEGTLLLTASGHAFGKAHGIANPECTIDPQPEVTALEKQGFGWVNNYGKGNAEHVITSSLEGA